MKETYSGSVDPNPSYISSLPSPMRRRHKDDLLVRKNTVSTLYIQEDFYNAWEEDIAVVNIFFGKKTVMGGVQRPKI